VKKKWYTNGRRTPLKSREGTGWYGEKRGKEKFFGTEVLAVEASDGCGTFVTRERRSRRIISITGEDSKQHTQACEKKGKLRTAQGLRKSDQTVGHFFQGTEEEKTGGCAIEGTGL